MSVPELLLSVTSSPLVRHSETITSAAS